MNQWQNLYDRFVGLDLERRRREKLERARAEAIQAFDAWCSQAVDNTMREIHHAMSRRALDFERCTGCAVQVQYPARPAIKAPPDGPYMTFLHLHVGFSQVHLYSHRLSGAWPLLHSILVASDARSGPPSLRNRTLVTLPRCMIVQRADGVQQLRRVAPADPQRDGEPIDVEEVVYRCFELLVDGLRRAA
ncbi:MAG: hypothetical protein HY898_20045 [Deltaproteobacteria bacterium]|nr:hypothetical protein [Deltaproteobacteria bacterium]